MGINLFKGVVAKKSSHFPEGISIAQLIDMIEVPSGNKVVLEREHLVLKHKEGDFHDHDQLAMLFMAPDKKHYAIRYFNTKGYVKAEDSVLEKGQAEKHGFILDKEGNRIESLEKTEQANKIFADVLGRLLSNSKYDTLDQLYDHMIKAQKGATEGKSKTKAEFTLCGLRVESDEEKDFLFVKNILSYEYAVAEMKSEEEAEVEEKAAEANEEY